MSLEMGLQLLFTFMCFVCGASSSSQPHLPSWPATYNITQSTIIMPCNYSGYFDYEIAGKFAIVDYDWSNGKEMWANPDKWNGGLAADGKMDCEERLMQQAKMTKDHAKSLGIDQKVWIYRNLVKALPWYSTVRNKLNDSAYAGFFLKFDPKSTPYHVPQCDDAFSPSRCSPFYHDQEQSPQSAKSNCRNCGHCDEACDCGTHPCGEYLWDHRNGSMLRDFLVNEYIGGATGLASENVDGVFIDDDWYASGPTEEDPHCVADMGLSQADVDLISKNWNITMQAVSDKLAEKKGWSWQMCNDAYPGSSGNADPKPICSSFLREACQPNSSVQNNVSIYTFAHNPAKPWPKPFPLPYPEQDVAMFLLSRGEYAYIGYGWQGCECQATDQYDNCLPHNMTYEFPDLLYRDFGEPTSGLCTETAEGSGIFQRKWSNADIEMDCNTWKATITMV